MDLSLDDLIKKNKSNKKIGLKSKLRAPSGGKATTKKNPGKHPVQGGKKVLPKTTNRLVDARSKIIQKNRVKIRDARDKIAENARSSIRDARELLSKKPATSPRGPKKQNARARPNRGLKTANMMEDDDFDIEDLNALHLKPVTSLKRTVHNEMFLDRAPPISMPKMPSFSISRERPPSPDPFECYVVPTRRPVPLPPIRSERIDNYHLGRSNSSRTGAMSAHMDAYESRKPILRAPISDDHDDRFEDDRYFSQTDNVRSRLFNDGKDRNESAGIFAKLPVRGRSPQAHNKRGCHVIISNLHPSVTESEVHELFSDVGPLFEAKLVRKGSAVVVYKNIDDAMEAIDKYNYRQIDGQPMRCEIA